jgi:N-acyl-D-amino-acid deacylase
LNRSSLVAGPILLFVGTLAGIAAEERPLKGQKVPAFAPLDKVVLDFADRLECGAATVAVSRDGKLIYSRGYGWADKEKKKPTEPDALMRVGNVTTAFTAAAIFTLMQEKKLTPETKAFELLALNVSKGKEIDPRIMRITVAQLLEHKGGWDISKGIEPRTRLKQIETDLGLSAPPTATNVIEYMLTQPLQFAPGEQKAISTFGYSVLGRVIEKTTRKPFFETVDRVVCKPLRIKDVKLGRSDSTKRDPREVWYPVGDADVPLELMDAGDGMIASAPALCAFMQAFWLNGEPRKSTQSGSWYLFGALPGTMALAIQREDGYNVAVLFNGRREKHYQEDCEALRIAVDVVVTSIVKKK